MLLSRPPVLKWWSSSLLIAALLFLILAHASQAQETEILPACQIQSITFDQSTYNVGDPINSVVTVTDESGTALGGANVFARVEKSVATSQQADTGFNLINKTGTYEGRYTQTGVAGLYQFFVTVTDPTGSRFAPCTEQASVQVGEGNGGEQLADLTVSTLRFGRAQEPAVCEDPANPLRFMVTVNNQGAANATAFLVAVDGVTQTVDSLAAGDSTTLFFDNPGGEVTVLVDSANQVTESDEDNNSLTQIIPIPTPLPPCDATATPTPDQPTVTPTPDAPTPTPTNTPVPGNPVVQPDPLNLSLCSTSQSMSIQAQNVTDLTGFDVVISFDPQVVQVVDADSATDGVQVTVGNDFATAFGAVSTVDNSTGSIAYARVLLTGAGVDGNIELLNINWEAVAGSGSSPVQLQSVTLVNDQAQEIQADSTNGSITIATNCGNDIAGVVQLQGRTDHSGVTVQDALGQQTQTDTQGSFTMTGMGLVEFSFPGYLPAQANVDALAQSSDAPVDVLDLGSIELLAGDINGDNQINLLDLTYLAINYNTADSLADLNGDGQVTIVDLALTANNYKQQGPLAMGQ